MTLDLTASPEDQRALSRWLRSWGLPLERVWLEPSGARCQLAAISAEIDLGLSADDAGALVVDFEAARGKLLGASVKLPGPAWRWQVRKLVQAFKAPAGVTLALDDEARLLTVRVVGLRFVRVLVNANRLILELERYG